MINLKFPKKTNHLRSVYDKAVLELDSLPPGSDEYNRQVDHVAKLIKLMEQTAPPRVSRDTVVICATNLAGILVIVGYERAHVVTSKAFNFVVKSR